MLFNSFRLSRDFHIGRTQPGTSRLQTTLPFNFDQAYSTSSSRIQSRVVAESGDFDAFSAGDFDNRFTGASRNGFSVDVDLKFFYRWAWLIHSQPETFVENSGIAKRVFIVYEKVFSLIVCVRRILAFTLSEMRQIQKMTRQFRISSKAIGPFFGEEFARYTTRKIRKENCKPNGTIVASVTLIFPIGLPSRVAFQY